MTIDDVKKLENVKIVDIPRFVIYYIVNKNGNYMLESKHISVNSVDKPSLYYLKRNINKSIFYIYEISDTHARWYESKNDKEYKNNRKEKLEALKKIELEL